MQSLRDLLGGGGGLGDGLLATLALVVGGVACQSADECHCDRLQHCVAGACIDWDAANGSGPPDITVSDAGLPDIAEPEPRMEAAIDATVPPEPKIVALPLSINADALGFERLGYSETSVDGTGSVFTCAGRKEIRSAVLVEVDTSKRYRVSGRFRAVGAKASMLYFGVATFDENYEHIAAWHAMRHPTAVTIMDLGQQTIFGASAFDGWGGENAHKRLLGFYYDGHTDHLPDRLFFGKWGDGVWKSLDPADGAFAVASGTSLRLNAALSSQGIVRGTSRVMNHFSGSSYVYAAAHGIAVPNDGIWQSPYTAELTGEGFNGSVHEFRPETKYVRLLLLLNHGQDETAVTEFKDLTLELVE